MPYAPGIAYRGDQYLYQGLTSAVDRIEREREKAKQDKKLFDSYVTQGEAMGLNPDVLKVQSLGGVAGMVEGQKLKRLQEHQDIANRYQQTQTEALNQQIANYGPTQQRLQEESGLRMEQIRGQMAAKARHDEALKQFGGRFAELSNQPDPAVLAALRAQQDALGAMGGVGVPVEALAEYAPKRLLTGQEIGLEGIKAGLDPQALASFIHSVAPQGQREGRGAPVWSPVPNTNFMQGYIPGAGSLVTLPRKPEEAPAAPDVATTDDGRKFQRVIDPRTGAVGWKALAMEPVPNPVREIQGQMIKDLYDEQQRRKAATNGAPARVAAPAAQAPSAAGGTPNPEMEAEFVKRWRVMRQANPNMTPEQAEAAQQKLARDLWEERRR